MKHQKGNVILCVVRRPIGPKNPRVGRSVHLEVRDNHAIKQDGKVRVRNEL